MEASTGKTTKIRRNTASRNGHIIPGHSSAVWDTIYTKFPTLGDIDSPILLAFCLENEPRAN